MSSYRPRRTRIYDANYDIGERYYKNQLNELDKKYNPSSFASSTLGSSSSKFDSFARDFTPAREEHFPSKVTFMNDLEDDEDLAFASKLKNIRKKNLADFEADDDFMDTSSSSRFRRGASSKLHENFLKETNDFGIKAERSPFVDDLEDQMQSTSRRLKMRSENIFSDASNNLSTASVEASSRAKASKARLAELESEMQNLTDKHFEREKRNNNLKKLLNESDATTAASSEFSSFASSSFKKTEI